MKFKLTKQETEPAADHNFRVTLQLQHQDNPRLTETLKEQFTDNSCSIMRQLCDSTAVHDPDIVGNPKDGLLRISMSVETPNSGEATWVAMETTKTIMGNDLKLV